MSKPIIINQQGCVYVSNGQGGKTQLPLDTVGGLCLTVLAVNTALNGLFPRLTAHRHSHSLRSLPPRDDDARWSATALGVAYH